jgi:hypothetical protein
MMNRFRAQGIVRLGAHPLERRCEICAKPVLQQRDKRGIAPGAGGQRTSESERGRRRHATPVAKEDATQLRLQRRLEVDAIGRGDVRKIAGGETEKGVLPKLIGVPEAGAAGRGEFFGEASG